MTAPESRDAQSGVEEVLAGAIDREWMRPEHDCDGTDRQCAERCPRPAYQRMGLEELRDAAVAAVTVALTPVIAGERAKALREAAERWADYEFVEIAWLREAADQAEVATGAPQAAVAPNSGGMDPRATDVIRGAQKRGERF